MKKIHLFFSLILFFMYEEIKESIEFNSPLAPALALPLPSHE
jgi:hypothetical protein